MIKSHNGRKGRYSNAACGKFFPMHPEKYCGSQIPEYKSDLERRCMMYLDRNEAVVSWSYEPTSIQYLDKSCFPAKLKRYYIDFIAKIRSGTIIKTVWIEVKPLCETIKPKNNNIESMQLWLKNTSKWQAAQQLAKKNGFEFHIVTERELN